MRSPRRPGGCERLRTGNDRTDFGENACSGQGADPREDISWSEESSRHRERKAECAGFVIELVGVQPVIQLSEELVEQVPLRLGVTVPVVSASPVVCVGDRRRAQRAQRAQKPGMCESLIFGRCQLGWGSAGSGRAGAGWAGCRWYGSGCGSRSRDLVPDGESSGHFGAIVVSGEAKAAGPEVWRDHASGPSARDEVGEAVQA